MGRFNDFKVSFDGVVNDLEIISNSSISSFTFETVPERRDRIVHFNAFSLNSSAGFGRISIPITLMTYPFIVLLNDEEVTPKLLNINDSSRTCTYLSYSGTNSSIEIIYSEILHLYYDLLDKYNNLQGNFSVLNSTYAMLIENFTKLQSDFAALNSLYTSLQSDFQDLNTTCQSLLANFANLQSDLQNLNNTYNELLVGFGSLQANLTSLSDSYNSLLNSYNSLQSSFSVLNSAYNGLSSGYTLLQAQLQTLNDTYHTLFDNYTRLQEEFNSLNSSYYGSILGSSEQAQNVRNLMYIFAGMTAIFIITTIYLSKKAHTGLKFKARSLEE
jgi:predicted nuclease with TOPRIM domain